MWASNKTGLAKISLEIFLTRYATSQKIVISKQIDKRSSISRYCHQLKYVREINSAT